MVISTQISKTEEVNLQLQSTPIKNNSQHRTCPKSSRRSRSKCPLFSPSPCKPKNHNKQNIGGKWGVQWFPSPLDRLRQGRRQRAIALGLTPPSHKEAFEANQSFPPLSSRPLSGRQTDHDFDFTPIHKGKGEMDFDPVLKSRCTLQKFKGTALNSFSFSCLGSGSPYYLQQFQSSLSPFRQPLHQQQHQASIHQRSLSGSWALFNFLQGGAPLHGQFPCTAIRNPNKAILTINAKSTEILVMNKVSCELLGLSQTQFPSGKRLCEFLSAKKCYRALSEVQLCSTGEMVLVSGKVMDLVTSSGEVVPVSVWMRSISNQAEPRCIVVMEPVDRAVGVLMFDTQGTIIDADKNMALLHGYQFPDDLKKLNVKELFPSLLFPCTDSPKLPKEIHKQSVAGRTCNGSTFPVSIKLEKVPKDVLLEGEPNNGMAFCATAWVFANLSGLITIFPDGTIHSCNDNFALMLFGFTQTQLIGKNILSLIPSFYEDLDFLDTDSMPLPPLEDEEEESNLFLCDKGRPPTSESISSCTSFVSRPGNPMGKQIELMIENIPQCNLGALTLSSPMKCISFLRNSSASAPPTRSPSADCLLSTPATALLPSGSCHAQLNEATDQTVSGFPSSSSCCADMNGNGSLRPLLQKSHRALSAECSIEDVESIKLDQESCQPGTSGQTPQLELNISHSNSTSSTVHSPGGFSSSDSSECGSHDGVCFSSEATDGAPVPTETKRDQSQFPKEEVGLQEEHLQDQGIGGDDSLACGGLTSTLNDLTFSERIPRFILNKYGSLESVHTIPEGSYFGLGMHRDGSDLAIVYQIRRLELDDGQVVYCLWVSRDLEEIAGDSLAGRFCNLTLASSNTSLVRPPDSPKLQAQKSLNEKSSSLDYEASYETKEKEIVSGVYSDNYCVLNTIGEGGFGCVKKSYRNRDKLLVVTKFICKSSVYDELWVFDSVMGKKVPLEVSLLMTLKHPNIVQVLDVYENDKYFQMVMERHGSGMDLFEFIERSPRLDEPLTSHIFRQLVSALSYLHSLNIVHRDVKDENIILDERFQVKLIDFGSATFMAPNWLFSTFCGTVEYCSPEVLEGNKYRGPELEVWAVGVTLYTLIFSENPFVDVEETMEAVLAPPFKVSQSLIHLISWMLTHDPSQRCTLAEAAEHSWTKQPVIPENYSFATIVRAAPDEICPPKFYVPEENKLICMTELKNEAMLAEIGSQASFRSESDGCYEDRECFS